MNDKMIALYKVTFREYTNNDYNVVRNIPNEKINHAEITKYEYLNTPEGYLIIPDYAFSKYVKWGNGFATCDYIGSMYLEDFKDDRNNE